MIQSPLQQGRVWNLDFCMRKVIARIARRDDAAPTVKAVSGRILFSLDLRPLNSSFPLKRHNLKH